MAGISQAPIKLPSTGGTPLESVIQNSENIDSGSSGTKSILQRMEDNDQEEKDFVSKKLSDRDSLKQPGKPNLPPAPLQQDYTRSPMEAFGSGAGFLATFGSMLTRRPLTNALNAGTAVMNAYKAQDATAFSTAFDKWKKESDNAWKIAEWDNKQYKDLLDKDSDDIRLHALSTKNTTMLAALQAKMQDQTIKDSERNRLEAQKGTQTIVDYVGEQEKKARESGMSDSDIILAKPKWFGEAISASKGTSSASPSWSDAAIEKAADAVAGGVRLNVAAPGIGKNNPNRDAVMNKLAEKYPDINLADIEAEYAGTTSENRSVGTASGKLKLSANLLHKAIPLARDAVSKIDLTNYPSLNALENAYRTQTGNPEISAAYVALQTVMSDYSALIARNGVSTDSTRAAAHELINKNMASGQLNSVFDQMEKERDNILGAVQDTRSGKISNNGTRIKVMDPDGKPHTIDESELDEALDHGWKQR